MVSREPVAARRHARLSRMIDPRSETMFPHCEHSRLRKRARFVLERTMRQPALLSFVLVLTFAPTVRSASAQEHQPTLSYSPWTKICLSETCFVGGDGSPVPDCGAIVSAVLIERSGEAKKLLHVFLPPGVSRERGVRISIDQDQPNERPYAECFVRGCMAEYDGGPELVASLKNGRVLTLEAVDGANSLIRFTMPLVGFADAYNGAPQVPKVIEVTQGKLKAEIEERDNRCGIVK